MGDDWRGWKNGKYDRRYKGVKRHSGQKPYKLIIISLVLIGVAISGFLIFQNNVDPQTVQKEISDAFKSSSNAVQKISSEASKQTTLKSENNGLIAVSNNVLTEDNYYAELVPTDIQVTDKGRYNVITLTVTINVKNLPFDGTVYFEDLYTTLKDENSKEYKPDKAECSMNDLIPIIGKTTDKANYSVCYSVNKTSEKFSIFYTEPQFNYHATRAGHLSFDSDLFRYYDSHRSSTPHKIGIIDLTKQ